LYINQNDTMKNTFFTTLLFLVCLNAYSQLKVDITHNLDENSGNVFDVDVRLSDFENLFAFQLFMKWDSTMYRIDGVPYFNEEIPGFLAQNIVLPVNDANKPEKGKVRLVWTNATTYSMADETLIATLRFTAIGGECDESPFTFEDIGDQESEQLLAADAAYNDIGINYQTRTIQIPGADCLTSNSELISEDQISVYPVPARDVINVDLDINLPVSTQLQVYSLQGELVNIYEITGLKNSLDITALQAGTYFYELRNGDKLLQNGKFIKVN